MWTCDPAITSEIVGTYHGLGPVFVQALTRLLAAQCALIGDHLWPADATEAVLQDPNYDFIVVGAGSAGAVVANRLSEVPDWKVLLVEAGGNPTLATEIPQLFFNNVDSPIDWGYKHAPQEGACRSYKSKSCAWPRAKVLGGCSSINAMFYVRASKVDYDEWAADGNTGWSYDEILPYFKKSENFSGILTEEDKPYHSKDGYLNVESKDDDQDLEKLLIQAATELGLKHVLDINGVNLMGVTKSATTMKDGVRQSTARAFLSPIKDRKNFHVLKNAYATKLLFKFGSNEVNGVIVNKDGKDITINAKKEIIVSGGAINTPQLLMLSGIGPRKHLEDLSIEVKADLPVGENLQDHPYVPIYYKLPGDQKTSMAALPNLSEAFAQYILEKRGPLANTANRITCFINTTDSFAVSPDIQFHHFMYPPNAARFSDFYKIHGFGTEFQEKFRALNEGHIVLMVAAVLLKPKSKGKIVLKSKDPFEHPIIYPNYFEDYEDLLTIMRGIRQYSLKLAETESFKASGLNLEWIDLEACKNYDQDSDDFLECYSRELTVSLYHPTSTARMGPKSDENSVVDNELKVKKVSRLRVTDASVMPTVVRGNTNAPIIMIAEKGADLIKQSWLNGHTEL